MPSLFRNTGESAGDGFVSPSLALRTLQAAALILTCLPHTCAQARVVSLNLCTDQLLVMLAPEQVKALDRLARDPALSFVAEAARHLPVVQADAEAVLELHPDLVLAGRYGAQTTIALLRQRGLRVVQLDEAENFDQIAAQTMQVAQLLDVRPRGEALVAAMRARLAAIRPRAAGRSAILWQARGWTAGPGSLGDAVLRQAGLRNLGTGGVIGREAMLAHPPDVLVTETAPEFPSLATDMVRGPALQVRETATIDPALLICGGPFSVAAAEKLAR